MNQCYKCPPSLDFLPILCHTKSMNKQTTQDNTIPDDFDMLHDWDSDDLDIDAILADVRDASDLEDIKAELSGDEYADAILADLQTVH